MTGYRAMSYRFVKTFPVLSRNFEIETEMTIHAIDKNMQVENVVIEYRDRPEGSESKLNTYADGFKVLKTIVKMFKNYKPLEFFSLIAAVLFVVGMAFFIPVLVHFLEVGTVEKIPTLIVSGFVILTAIICWFSGIILSTLVNQHKQDFEYQTQMVTNRYKDLFIHTFYYNDPKSAKFGQEIPKICMEHLPAIWKNCILCQKNILINGLMPTSLTVLQVSAI